MRYANARVAAFCGAWMAVMLLLAGCGGGPSMVTSGYDDFSAYFNTYYNAQKAFEEGQLAVGEQEEVLDRNVYLSLFPMPERVRSRSNFQDAIEKSAAILRKHPNSRWVDDALMLIGKSYFYLNNFAGAEQKFREVIGLGSARGEEARFWLARALTANGSHAEGVQHLQESLLREGLSDHWRPRLHLVLGELYVQRSDWEEAITELKMGLEQVGERDLKARAYFLLGQVYETTGQYAEAVTAFKQAQRQRPAYEVAYAAEVSAIRAEGLYGEAEKALDWLEAMENDDKHYEHRAELAFMRGRIYQSQGRADEAAALYRDLLYDSDARMANGQPRVHHAMAELYRDHYSDYVTAAAHFDTAATALSRGSSYADEANLGPEALTGVREQADMFGTFAEVRSRIHRLDSLLHLSSLDEQAFRERILQMRQAKARRLVAQRQEQDRRDIEQAFQENRAERQEDAPQDAAEAQSEAGFLFHEDPVRVQEGREGFLERWGTRPLVENWRRLGAISAVADEQAEVPGGVDREAPGLAKTEGRDELPAVDISAVPRDSLGRSRMLADQAFARYELGNVLFLMMNRPDSAAVWYRRVIEEEGHRPVADRAYYALAEVRRSQGDTAAARDLYQEVLRRNPDADLANRVRSQLGRQVVRQSSRADSLAQAENAYASAFSDWRQHRYAAALEGMMGVAGRYASTPVAPKALLAAGSIYLEWARQDSLELSAGLPLTLSDSLLARSGLGRKRIPPPVAPDTTTDVVLDSAALDVVAPDTVARDSTDEGAVAHPLLADASSGAGRLPLSQLYSVITEHYPKSPQADRAHLVLAALQERGLVEPVQEKASAGVDTTNQGATANGQKMQGDQQAQVPVVQTPASKSGTGQAGAKRSDSGGAPEVSPFGLRGQSELAEGSGGYTWIVASRPEPGDAYRMVQRYRRAGFRTEVVVRMVDGQRRHEVAVGQFKTRKDALAQRNNLPADSSANPEVVPVSEK